jgi:two-component system, NtrC family, response regulator GlrR
MASDASTLVVSGEGKGVVVSVPRFRLRVAAGPDAGASVEAQSGRATVGTAEGATLRLTDPTVSRFHLEFEASPDGIVVRDLGSTNGTRFGEIAVRELVARSAVVLEIGRSRIELHLGRERDTLPTAVEARMGSLIGGSAAMRAVFAVLERASPTTAPVLVTGESGTGKELAARAVHDASPRAGNAFEIVDCGGLPATLVESLLFGHDRGAFTGATEEREGAFERADGGTIFLDEIGELPLELQPKLLRVLGEQQIRRVGGRKTRKIDVRVVAATNRDLRKSVNSGGFRADLFYRLAVIEVRMPPLRDRPEDLPSLVRGLLEVISRERRVEAHLEPDAALLDSLAKHAWPGNVRELRNYLEQLVILRVPPALGDGALGQVAPSGSFEGLEAMPLRAAKSEVLERFERHYVTRLLERTGGNVAEAARRAGVDRVTLFRTLRRYGLSRHES